MNTSLIAVARRFLFVRETEGPNAGAFVEFFQRFCGGHIGDSWCAQFASVALDIAYHGKSPLVRSGATTVLLADARSKGLVSETPTLGGLYFFVYETTREPHHVGVVTGIDPLIGISGNTSVDGTSSEGTGVFEHQISDANTIFVRLPQ